jgi:Zn-dependent protease
MQGTFKVMTVRGVPVFLHWTFLLVLAWMLFVNVSAGNDFRGYVWSFIFFLSVVACIALHDAGHAMAAYRFGISPKKIVLMPVGDVAGDESFSAKPIQELVISLAGPLVNSIIALLLLFFFPAYKGLWPMHESIGDVASGSFFYHLYILNIAFAVFNLIPAFPMDGGRVFRSLLSMQLSNIRATSVVRVVGKIIGLLFVIVGIIIFKPVLPLIGLFIFFWPIQKHGKKL